MSVEPREFFRDVDAHAVHRHFLTNALGDFFLARCVRAFRHDHAQRFLQTIDDLLLMTRDQIRHERLQVGEDRFHLFDALDEARLELSAFAATHFDEIADGGASGVDHGVAQRFGRHRFFAEHARPAQDLTGAHALGVREQCEHLLFERGELLDGIDVERTVRAVLGTLHVDTDIDFATREFGGERFAQHRLAGARFFGHAECQIEEARIDRAQFDRHARACGSIGMRNVARDAGVAGHTVDIVVFHRGDRYHSAVTVFQRRHAATGFACNG